MPRTIDAPGSSLTATLQTEPPVAVIDATWPATADSATFTVHNATQCSTATLHLVGVSVRAPDGHEVSLGDVTVTNTAWQWWPPFECHRDDVQG